MGKNSVPDRWESYSNTGVVIKGTRLVAFKVPLKPQILNQVKDKDELWGIPQLHSSFPRLKLVIDLTNTHRYYSPQDLKDRGIGHVKIMTEGHVVPNNNVVQQFFNAINGALEEGGEDLVGVHCTHGVNRTGYLICRYMVEILDMEPDVAIQAFDEARGHKIERVNYLENLRQKAWKSVNSREHETDGAENISSSSTTSSHNMSSAAETEDLSDEFNQKKAKHTSDPSAITVTEEFRSHYGDGNDKGYASEGYSRHRHRDCFKCGEKGHQAQNCPQRGDRGRRDGEDSRYDDPRRYRREGGYNCYEQYPSGGQRHIFNDQRSDRNTYHQYENHNSLQHGYQDHHQYENHNSLQHGFQQPQYDGYRNQGYQPDHTNGGYVQDTRRGSDTYPQRRGGSYGGQHSYNHESNHYESSPYEASHDYCHNSTRSGAYYSQDSARSRNNRSRPSGPKRGLIHSGEDRSGNPRKSGRKRNYIQTTGGPFS